ncbi:MAG: Uma2 family endonuclease [Deltaproteobacteria bacterium]|nr:Uma2 family endonuclease [Deltaproteobacteria bacterium]
MESSDDHAGRVRGLRRSEYEQLIALGAFHDEPIELVRGALVTMSPQGEPHAWSTAELHRSLVKQLDDEWQVRSHSGLAVADDSMPEPDVAVVPFDPERRRPTAAVLVVEVSFSSLRFDRGVKAALYAEAGVPTYWIVDLVGRRVHVHTEPRDGSYQRLATHPAGASLSIDGLPGVVVATAPLFPPEP